MPEGDSYTRARRKISPVLLGEVIEEVEGSAPDVRKRSAGLLGATVDEIRTHGKHLMIDTDAGLTVHVHLGMPGRFRVSAPGRSLREDRGSVRFAATTRRGSVWVISAPTVEVDRRAIIDHHLRRLGADVLAPQFDWERFESQSARYPGDRTVSDFLLDQRVMAGVGNEYKCEVLYLEGIRPDRPMSNVDSVQRRALATRARALMLPNSERPMRSTTGRRHPDSQEWVFERAGRGCRRCAATIASGRVGQHDRITYWCPNCQS